MTNGEIATAFRPILAWFDDFIVNPRQERGGRRSHARYPSRDLYGDELESAREALAALEARGPCPHRKALRGLLSDHATPTRDACQCAMCHAVAYRLREADAIGCGGK